MIVPSTNLNVSVYAKSMADAMPSDIPPIPTEGLVRVRVAVIGSPRVTGFWSEPVPPEKMQSALAELFAEVAKFIGPNLTPIEKP